MKKQDIRTYTLLFLILGLGLYLRLRHWPNFLTFDYEKARDLIASMKIFTEKKLTLIGPVSEVEGIFHGPLYYYLVGFFYYIFKGDPRAGSIVSFLFNLSSVYILFHIGKNLFNAKVGLISAFIYAASFEAISYAYWLSNPGPSVPFLFLMFYFFYKFCTKNEKYLIPSLFCLAMAIQFQILNIIFTLPLIVLYFVLGRTKIGIKNIFLSLAAFLLPLASFVLFDYRHKLLMFNSFIKNYFVSNGNDRHFGFNLLNYLERFITEFSNIFFPSNRFLSLIILFIVTGVFITKIIRDKRNKLWKFLAVWIFSTIPIFLINSRMNQSSAAFIGVSGGLIILFSCLVEKLFSNEAPSSLWFDVAHHPELAEVRSGYLLPLLRRQRNPSEAKSSSHSSPPNRRAGYSAKGDKKSFFVVFFLIPIFLSNLFAIDHFLTDPGKRLFDFFQGQFYKTDIAAVKYIYEESENSNFKVDTVTSPLLISPLWDYLLSWYSQKNSLPLPKRTDERIQFLIIEPYVDDFYKNQAMQKKAAVAKRTDSKYFGNIVVEKWAVD